MHPQEGQLRRIVARPRLARPCTAHGPHARCAHVEVRAAVEVRTSIRRRHASSRRQHIALRDRPRRVDEPKVSAVSVLHSHAEFQSTAACRSESERTRSFPSTARRSKAADDTIAFPSEYETPPQRGSREVGGTGLEPVTPACRTDSATRRSTSGGQLTHAAMRVSGHPARGNHVAATAVLRTFWP